MSGYRFFDPEYDEYLMHYGVSGQKHGVRNYQFVDGTWTELGKERRRIGDGRGPSKIQSESQVKRRYSKKSEEKFKHSIEADVNAINKKDYCENCGYCAIAYELRRRGFDAESIYSTKGIAYEDLSRVFSRQTFNTFKSLKYGSSSEKMMNALRSLKTKDYSNLTTAQKEKVFSNAFSKKEIRAMENELVSQGDGARGIIWNGWAHGDGYAAHYFNYEVSNGSVHIVDCQSRMVFRGLEHGYLDQSYFAMVLRTDDTSINNKALKKLFGHEFDRKESS